MRMTGFRRLAKKFVIAGCVLVAVGVAQMSAGERDVVQAGTRAKTGSAVSTAAVGNAKWFRFGIVDGNLVNGGLTNSGLLGYHYVSGNPFLSWPKGPRNVEYLHGAVFYAAGQVIGDAGDRDP